MALGPIECALDAIAAHFDALSGVVARRGWPEKGVAETLTSGDLVTVTHVSHERSLVPPTPLNDGALVQYRVADLRISAQLDLWASYRIRRDTTALVIETALHNQIPIAHGLWLASTGYFSRPLTITSGQGVDVDDDEDSHIGEFRRRWMLDIQTDLVIEAATPQQLQIVLRPQGGIAGLDTTIS